ncbi:ABC transporter permease [Paenibacillus selenitireducens]|uniref:ABC transporter permease n=1 Tax=Paenibacillus selenitireducens TaxID=1324314 RepID=A0A1T2X3C0_9BACL|nr:ABC transporter permease [Paenibacillus selenitireducens]OPA74216.1 ABC transporter permease [Paenibacillus selenitireducens]
MNAVWTLFRSNLRTKKVQNVLTTVLILLSTLLLATAMIVISNTQNLFSDMHSQTNGSHQMLMLENGLHDPKSVKQWWDVQQGVTASEMIPYRNLSGITHHGKEMNNIYMFMMDTPQLPITVDKLIGAQGNVGSAPEAGTIWIPTSLSYSNGIAVGDTVGFKTGKSTFELKVAAVVVDMPFGAPFTRNARIWMNTQDYKELLQPLQGKDKYMMGLRFDNYDTNTQYWERFEQQLRTPYLESKMEFESISSFYLIMNKVIGFVMIFLGAVMLLVALFTIGFTISDAILANYRTIGVLKSCGLSSFGIIGTYIAQYAFLSIIGIIPGLISSQFLSKVIVESSLSSLKTNRSELSVQGDFTAIIVGVSVLALVILCVLFYANKARSVQPVQAIRYGMSELDSNKSTRRLRWNGHHPVGFDRLPVTFVIGLRNLLKNVKGSILTLLLTVITSAVLVFGFVFLFSIHSIQQTAPSWGYDNSHIAVDVFNKAALSHTHFEEDMLSDPRIKNFGWIGEATGVIPSEPSERPGISDTPSMNVHLGVADGSYDDLGYTTLKGNNPRLANEIAIGVNVSKKLNKDVGDMITVYINGKKHSLLVTGIYQAIANMSYSARITADVFKEDHLDYSNAAICLINLHDSGLSDQVAKDINRKYKEALSAVTQKALLDSVYKEAVDLLIMPMSIMGLLFIVVTCIIIYITCRITIRKESKTYGIYKSLGLTSNRIRASLTQGIVALSVIGALLGIGVGVYVLPMLLENILSYYGILEVPLIMHWGGIMAAAFASIVSTGIGSWLSSRVIAKTSPRILVIE